MKIVDLNTIKSWFKAGKKPTESQFHAWMDSFWHKLEKIPMEIIDGLGDLMAKKLDADQFDTHLMDENAHKELFKNKVDTSHLTDANAHQTLFDQKADASALADHIEDPEAHEELFNQKVDTSHLTDTNAHQALFNQKVDTSHLTDANAHQTLFDQKVDKEPGKGLSSNDFTDAHKNKLDKVQLPEDLQVFESLNDARKALGDYKVFLYSETNSDGVVSPGNSVMGVTYPQNK